MQYGTKQSLQKQLNLQAHNMDLQLILFEELRIMAGIADQTFHFMMSVPVQHWPVVREEPVDPLALPVTVTAKVKEPVPPSRKANPVKTRNRKKKKL